MINTKQRGRWVIITSFLVALMLTAMPLPEWAVHWRPMWVAMVLIYWCMALPNRIGIGVAWCAGILLDVLQGTLFGHNALALAVIAYIVLNLHQRMRLFPLVQQAALISIICLIYLLMSLWIRGIMGVPPESWTFWMPALTSMLLWPWLFIILRDIRRKFNII